MGGDKARGQGSKLTLSSTRMMVMVDQRKTSRELWATVVATSNGYQPCGGKTLAIGSYRWAVRGEEGQWQFLNLKFGEFFLSGARSAWNNDRSEYCDYQRQWECGYWRK